MMGTFVAAESVLSGEMFRLVRKTVVVLLPRSQHPHRLSISTCGYISRAYIVI